MEVCLVMEDWLNHTGELVSNPLGLCKKEEEDLYGHTWRALVYS